MAYKINGTTVVDNSRNVCACCVTSCCITASSRMDAPSGNTASRPGSPATGSLYFDTDLGSLISYNGTAWATVGGGAETQCEISGACNESYAFSTYFLGCSYCDCCKCNKACCLPSYGATLGGDLHHCLYPGHNATCDFMNSFTCSGWHCAACDKCGFLRTTFYPAECSNGAPIMCCEYRGCNNFNFCCSQGFGYSDQGGVCCNKHINYFIYPDGNIQLSAYTRCTNMGHDWSGYFCKACNGHVLTEVFINKDGKASKKTKSSLFWCPASACCMSVDYGSLLMPTYYGANVTGQIPWISYPSGLCHWPRASCGFKCPAAFISTSDSFGTETVEVCCYARVVQNFGYDASFNYYSKMRSEYVPLDVYPCCMYWDCCCLSGTWHSRMGFSCCPGCIGSTSQLNRPHEWLDKIGMVFSNRTDMKGGGDIHHREMFQCTICTYNDGLTLKVPRPQFCCKLYLLAYSLPGSASNCRFICCCLLNGNGGSVIHSPDGCCLIHFHCMCSGFNTTQFCCQKVECCNQCPICYCASSAPTTTIIDRLNGCIKCMFLLHCIPMQSWQTCIGCTRSCSTCVGSEDFSNFRSRYCHKANRGSTLGNCAPRCSYPTLTIPCGAACSNPNPSFYGTYAHSFQFFSNDCSKAFFVDKKNACTDPAGVSIFGFTEGRPLCFVAVDCAICCALISLSALSYPQNQYLCLQNWGGQVGLSMVSCCCCHCCSLTKMTSCTGSANLSIFAKCVGYSIVDHYNHCKPCVMPMTWRLQGAHTYINKENDHYVYIGMMGNQCSLCFCAAWMGAICYDLINECISKVNTIYPASADVRQKVCCNIYQNTLDGSDNGYYRNCVARCIGCSHCLNCCWQRFGLDVRQYGNYHTFVQGGCVRKGGVYLIHDNLGILEMCAPAGCQNSTHCYFDCCNTGPEVGGHICGVAFCNSLRFTVEKVPFCTPLECVGWRSEPMFACFLNLYMSPVGGPTIFGDAPPGNNPGFCFRVRCACDFKKFPAPCLPVFCSNHNCDIIPCTCIARNRTWALKPFCCICVAICTNLGTQGPFTLEDVLKCSTSCACVNTIHAPACSFQMYDNILPCHLDCDNTTTRVINRFMSNQCTPSPLEFYSSGKFERQYVARNVGESGADRFIRLYNENVICCC